jgi:hypothetical protein
MRRVILFAVIAAGLASSFTPAHATTVKSGRLKFNAPVPCTVTCAYWTDVANGLVPGVTFQACKAPFPPNSYADKVLTAPSTADFLVLKLYPTIDWDMFLCSKPSRGNNGRQLAMGANDATGDCSVGCVETIRYRVKPGVRYVVRAYNWSDTPDVTGRYWFLNM